MTDRTDDTRGGKYPFGSIRYDVLMKAARLLHPLPFMLYVVLLVRSAGKGACWPSEKELAASMNTQIGAIKRGSAELIKAGFLTMRKGDDGLEHYILTSSEKEEQRRQRRQDRERTQVLADQRAAEHAELLRQKMERLSR